MYAGLYRDAHEAEEAEYAFNRMYGPQSLNQALYEESRRTQRLLNHIPLIQDLLSKELTCIIREWTEFCKHTDATIGVNVELIAAFPDAEFARAYFQSNYAVEEEEFDSDHCIYLKYPNGHQSYTGDEDIEILDAANHEKDLYHAALEEESLPF
jgi:hypothetical protein